MEELQFTFHINKKEYLQSVNTYYTVTNKHKLSATIFSIVTNLLFGIPMVIFFYPMGWFFISLSIIAVVYLFLVRYFNLIRSYKRNDELKEEFEVLINKEGYRSSTPNASSYYKWTYFDKIIETQDYYYLIFKKDKAFVLPRWILNIEDRKKFEVILNYVGLKKEIRGVVS